MGDEDAEDTATPKDRAEPGRLEHADLPVVPRQREPVEDAG